MILNGAFSDLLNAALLDDGRTIVNNGYLSLGPEGTLVLSHGAILDNRGTFFMRDYSTVVSTTGDGEILNENTFAGSPYLDTSVTVAVINSGDLAFLCLQSTDVTFLDGGTADHVMFNANTIHILGSTALMTLCSFTNTTIDGVGTLNLIGPTLADDNTWNVAVIVDALAITQGTLTVNNTVTAQVITVSGGIASFNGEVAVHWVYLSDGTLNGSGDITDTIGFDWTGGILAGAGQFILTPTSGGILGVDDTGILDGRTLDVNDSEYVFLLDVNSTLILCNDAQIINSGRVVLNDGASMIGDGLFENDGTVIGYCSTVSATIDVPFINNGTVIAPPLSSAGQLVFAASDATLLDGSQMTNVRLSGEALHIGTGDTATTTSTAFANTTLDGGGLLSVYGLTTLAGVNTLGNIQLDGDITVLGGASTLTGVATVNTLTVNGGNLTFGSGTATTLGSVHVSGGQLNLQGTTTADSFTQSGGSTSFSGTSLTINDNLTLSGGTFNSSNTITADHLIIGSEATFISGSGTVYAQVSDAGSIVVSGGELFIGGNSGESSGPGDLVVSNEDLLLNGGSITANHLWLLSSFSGTGTITADVTSSTGEFDVAEGGLTINGSFALHGGTVLHGDFTVTGSVVIATGGMFLNGFMLTAGSGVFVDDGYLVGPGSIVGNVTNNHDIFVVDISITGDFTQFSNGTLYVSANVASQEVDVLTVSGVATLNGWLNVSLPYGSPNYGDLLIFLRYGSVSGTFNVINGMFESEYGAHALNLWYYQH